MGDVVPFPAVSCRDVVRFRPMEEGPGGPGVAEPRWERLAELPRLLAAAGVPAARGRSMDTVQTKVRNALRPKKGENPTPPPFEAEYRVDGKREEIWVELRSLERYWGLTQGILSPGEGRGRSVSSHDDEPRTSLEAAIAAVAREAEERGYRRGRLEVEDKLVAVQDDLIQLLKERSA